MTEYGDEQGGSGQPARHGQFERQASDGEQPRLGHQYGGEPTYRQPPQYGQQQPQMHQYQDTAPWGQPPPGYVRGPQNDPNNPYSTGYQTGYRLDPGTKRDLGVPGLIVTIVGAVLLILGFTALDWYHNISGDSFGNGSSGGKFGDIHNAVTALQDRLDANAAVRGDYSFGISVTYFSWLGWVLLAVAVVTALISVMPTAATPVMRAVSFLVGLAGAACTIWAANLFSVSGPLKSAVQQQFGFSPTFSFWIKHSYLGGWFAVGGFVIVAFGGLLGSHRRV